MASRIHQLTAVSDNTRPKISKTSSGFSATSIKIFQSLGLIIPRGKGVSWSRGPRRYVTEVNRPRGTGKTPYRDEAKSKSEESPLSCLHILADLLRNKMSWFVICYWWISIRFVFFSVRSCWTSESGGVFLKSPVSFTLALSFSSPLH